VNISFNVDLPLIEEVVLLMLMLVPAIQACENTCFDDWFSALIFSISDKDGGNTTLIKAVYRDGKSLGSGW